MSTMHIEQVKASTPTVTVPAGRYFLGDPCYAVPGGLWMPLLESCGDFDASPVGKVGGIEVLAFSTAWGDGTYYDQFENEFPVDAGLIGLTPIDLALQRETLGRLASMGLVVEFKTETLCVKADGQLRFGQYVIET